MSAAGPSRRQLLIAALAASGAALAGGGWWLSRARRASWRDGARRWFRSSDLDAAVRIGEAYLALLPTVDGDALWRAVDDRLAPWPERGLGDATFRGRVRDAVERDFALEAVVVIEGYVFDETTARLCALVTLSQREAKLDPRSP